MADRFESPHTRHDVEAVAALASGDASDVQSTEGRSLIEICDDCLQLAQDLRVLTLSVQALPNAEQVASTRRAPRDFRLTPEMAASLRPASPVMRLTARITVALASFGRPLGVSMATLGLVGVLVGSANLGTPAAGGKGSTEFQATGASAGAPAPGSTFEPAAVLPQPTATDTRIQIDSPRESGGDTTTPPAVDAGSAAGDGGAAAARFTVASGVLIVLGVGLFLLGWMGRRRVRSRT